MRTRPTNLNEFPTVCNKTWLMRIAVVVVVVWAFLGEIRQVTNLSRSIRVSSLSGAIAIHNQSSSFAADPPASLEPSILNDGNGTLSPSRASANMAENDTPPPIDGEEQKSLPVPMARLRLDWTHLDLHFPMAKQIAAHQSSCDIPEALFPWRNCCGMGSDLHLWSLAMCRGMQLGQRLISPRPWNYWSQLSCPNNDTSSMTCYFPRSENLCPTPKVQVVAKKDNTSHPPSSQLRIKQMDLRVRNECLSTLQKANLTIKEFVGSATEFLFSSVSSRVVDSAVERLPLVFPPHGIVPPNLITLHIRWGDKKGEMDLVGIHSYIDACHQILQRRRDKVQESQGTSLTDSTPIHTNSSSNSQDEDPVHIYLATEDPSAVQAMRENMPSHWKLYVDSFVNEFSNYSQVMLHWRSRAQMIKAERGTPAMAGLASLLIAMEANDFVLTTASNWSRLMNDLRRFIVEQHFSTTVIDLRPSLRAPRKKN